MDQWRGRGEWYVVRYAVVYEISRNFAKSNVTKVWPWQISIRLAQPFLNVACGVWKKRMVASLPTLQCPDSLLVCKCAISGMLFRGFPCSTRFTRSGCVIQLNPMNIPSILPAATNFSPSSGVTCELRKTLVFLTKGRNVSRTSCWIPRDFPLWSNTIELAPTFVKKWMRDTNRQISNQAR